jgi:5-methylthioadenosine/S-adenosylhomocysteine deaminase
VSAPLYRASAAFARREGLPLAVHIAESRPETEFVRDGTGPFATLFGKRSIPVEAHHCSPVAYLMQLGVLARDTLCIHCVQVDAADVELLRATGAAVAHCPQSNAAHGHGRSPYVQFRKAGVPIGLGTDSVLSIGELDLWAEAEAAGLEGEAALRALTMEGARALGWEREIGSLEVGKAADLAVFSFAAPRRPPPPSAALLTVVSGKIVHQISGQ